MGDKLTNKERARETYIIHDGDITQRELSIVADVSVSTIRKWINDENWYQYLSKSMVDAKKRLRQIEKRDKIYQNKSPKRRKNNNYSDNSGRKSIHGVHENIFWEDISDKEKIMIDSLNYEEEYLLKQEIALLTIREKRLMDTISEYKGYDKADNLIMDNIVAETDPMGIGESIKQTEISPQRVLEKVERELTRVQVQKTNTIKALNEVKMNNNELMGDTESEIGALLQGMVEYEFTDGTET